MITIRKKDILERYTEQAIIYDRSRFGSFGGSYIHKKEISVISKFLRNGSVLELGVGTGRCAFSLIKEGFSLVGIDITLAMLKIAKARMKKLGLRFEVVNMDAESLGFIGEFDNIICFHTFHFLPHPLKTLRNAFNALRPGGRCVISFENRCLWNMAFNKFDVVPKNLYSPKKVALLFREAGFKIIDKRKLFNAPYRIYRKAPKYFVKQIMKIDQKRDGWLIGIVAGEKPLKITE